MQLPNSSAFRNALELQRLIEELAAIFNGRLYAAIAPPPDVVSAEEIDHIVHELEIIFCDLAAKQRMLVPDFLVRRWMTACNSPNLGRRREWLASRRALAEVCGMSRNSNGVLSFSLSHTATFGVAVGLLSSVEAPCSVGIDFERSDRSIDIRALRFTANANDMIGGEASLADWCAREAALKSFAAEKGYHLGDVWLRRIAPVVFAFGHGLQTCGTAYIASNGIWTASVAQADGPAAKPVINPQ